jgi:hypothetical protein
MLLERRDCPRGGYMLALDMERASFVTMRVVGCRSEALLALALLSPGPMVVLTVLAKECGVEGRPPAGPPTAGAGEGVIVVVSVGCGGGGGGGGRRCI